MSRSRPRIIRIVIITVVVFAALFLTGRWLQSLYGLDPPYAYFWTGALLQLGSFLVPVVAVIWLLVKFWRFRRRA